MSNLESSWEETIVQLAQAGNLRAVAFWLNRHLVAQGICVQATTNQPGQLTLQILCRQAADRDRLVKFICHQLHRLNSPVIRSVQMRAQLMGSSDLLWTQTVNFSPAVAAPVENASVTAPLSATAEEELLRVLVAANAVPASAVAENAGMNAVPADASASQKPPASAPMRIPIVLQPGSPPNPARSKPSSNPRSLKRKAAQWLKQSQQRAQRGSRQLAQSTERSILWFQRQKPRQKAIVLGGSAIAAFLLGSGFELVRHQVTLMTARSQNPEAAAGASYQGMVKTAIEQVPVIQLPGVHPDNTITLLFSNAIALTPTTGQSGIAAQQNADMLITSLNAPLDGLPPEASSPDSVAPADLPEAEMGPAMQPGNASETVGPEAVESEAAGPETVGSEAAGPQAVGPQAVGSEAVGPSPEASPLQFGGEDAAQADSDSGAEAETLPPVNLPPITLQQLQANGVNVVNLASNQLMQTGGSGLTHTIKSLSQASIYPIGAGADQQSARRPQIFSIQGKRVAYLGYSDVSLQTAGKDSAGLNTSVNAQIEADIKAIRDQVDWVIVSYHWNQNLRSYPEDWQVSLTHAAIDHGADLVVGYHPTVTQGAEVYGGRAIVYSLGSMLDPYQSQDSDPKTQTYETLALKLNLQDRQMQVELLPVRVSGGETEVLTPETGASILDYLKQASSLFRQPLRSPTTLDARIRLTLPAAPNSDKPFSEPFTADPSPSP